MHTNKTGLVACACWVHMERYDVIMYCHESRNKHLKPSMTKDFNPKLLKCFYLLLVNLRGKKTPKNSLRVLHSNFWEIWEQGKTASPTASSLINKLYLTYFICTEGEMEQWQAVEGMCWATSLLDSWLLVFLPSDRGRLAASCCFQDVC